MNTTLRRLLPAATIAVALGMTLAACGDDTPEAASPTAMESGAMAMPDGASASSGDLALTGFWVKESSLDLAAGFGTITNNGTEADALVAATAAGVPTVELHQTMDGVMQQVDAFPAEAGGSVTLEPGGNHLMFLGLTEPLVAGQNVDLTLSFASGETVEITAPVRPFTMEGHMDGGMADSQGGM
jgi:copper(I)-binding protein